MHTCPLGRRAPRAAAFDLRYRFLLRADLLLFVEQAFAPGVLDGALEPVDVVAEALQQDVPVLELDIESLDLLAESGRSCLGGVVQVVLGQDGELVHIAYQREFRCREHDVAAQL